MESLSSLVRSDENGPESSNTRLFYLVLIIGLLMGATITCLAGYLLWATGYIQVGEDTCPSVEEICPPTLMFELATDTATPATPTLTPEPEILGTATPDAGATATAACATFEAQFPGTPCP